MEVNASNVAVFSTSDVGDSIRSSLAVRPLFAKFAALQRIITTGRRFSASNATSKTAPSYEDNGMPA